MGSRNMAHHKKVNPLEVPNYTLEEAARYLHVSRSTLWYWVIGDSGAAPLTTIFSRKPPILLSFKNLVECFVLESLRFSPHDIPLKGIRRGVEELRRETQSKFPLADHQISTKGGMIYLDDDQMLVKLAPGGQRAFKGILGPFLKRVDRNTKGISERLFPFTRTEHRDTPDKAPSVVVIDPLVAFGKPVLVNSRISTAFLMSRRNGGASIAELANDYGRAEAEIQEAIYLEKENTAA